MMPKQKRTTHSPELKAKVALEAVRGLKTATEIAQEYGVHPVQVSQWKKALLEDSSTLFDQKRGPKPKAEYRRPMGSDLAFCPPSPPSEAKSKV